MSTDQDRRKHPRLYYLRWIFRQYRQHHRMILLLLVLTLVSTLISVLFPIVFKHIVDDLTTNLALFKDGNIDLAAATDRRNRMLWLLLALGLGPIFAGIYTYCRAYMNIFFEKFYREQYFAQVMDKPHTFFLTFRTGDLVTRLTEDVRTYPPGLAWLCCSGIFRAVNSTCLILFCLVSMFLLNPKLALAAMLPLPLMSYIFWRTEAAIEGVFKINQQGISETNDFLESGFSGIRIIKSFNGEQSQSRLFGSLMDRRVRMDIDVERVHGLFMVYFEFLNYVGEVLVLIFGGILVIRGELTLGTYYAFISYLAMIVFPLMDVPMMFVTLAQSFITIDRLEEIEQTAPPNPVAEGREAITNIASVAFERVSFRHAVAEPAPAPETGEPSDHRPFAFEDVSFRLQRGEKVAVVGRIGSGKTTLLNLLAGIFQPTGGSVLINDRPIECLELDSVRNRIGYIQQEPTVFSESIATNIDFWRDCGRSHVEASARLAQFDEEIRGFPEGYEEKVGQRGVTLSGGQRQRLSIARALAGNPEILLMDDVTSSLDAANEQRLWQDLHDQFPQITCLIVTHRLSTAQNADRIMVLANGRVDAIGTHRELMAGNDIYQELVHA